MDKKLKMDKKTREMENNYIFKSTTCFWNGVDFESPSFTFKSTICYLLYRILETDYL